MKSRFHILFTLAVLTTAGLCTSYAQDAGMQDVEFIDADKDKAEPEKFIYSPGESDSRISSSRVTVTKDTVTTAAPSPTQKPKAEKNIPAAPITKPALEKQPKEDESILSFNFLYYIIQKYKLQDIVD
jgi:hypothetical protein